MSKGRPVNVPVTSKACSVLLKGSIQSLNSMPDNCLKENSKRKALAL